MRRLLFTLLLWPGAAWAIDFPDESYHALPCRPTIACTADLVPPGVVELEAGYLYRRLGNGANQHSLPFLLKLTLAEWAQLQVGSNGFTATSSPTAARFFDDVTAGVKLHGVDQGELVPSLSLSAAVSIPTSSADGYLRTYDLFFTAYVTKDVFALHADLNLGLNLWRVEAPVRVQPWLALALSRELGGGVGVMVETYYFADARPVDSPDGGVLFAVSYSPRPWVVLDAGGDVGLLPTTRAASAFVGFTIIPLDLWDTGAERRARINRLTTFER